MADALVNFFLENLNKLKEKEADLLVGINEELKPVFSQLETMRLSLEGYEGVPQLHESINELVNQISGLAYDAEDVIDDYISRIRKNRKSHFLYKHIAKPRSGRRIKDIKKRSREICEKFGKEIKQVYGADDSNGREKALIAEEGDLVGFTSEKQTLIDRLIHGDLKRTAISIVGMVGLGKTTLALQVYKNSAVKEDFHHRAWILVSRKYTVAEIISDILKCLDPDTPEMEMMNEEELGDVLKDRLKGKKYLIVVDDLWELSIWEQLRDFFPDDNNGSRVLFTTCFKNLALGVNSDPMSPPIYLRFLDKKESWQLFRSKAFLGGYCSQKWEELGQDIAQKCDGLPLAISVLATLLSKEWGQCKLSALQVADRELYNRWSTISSHVSTFLFKNSAQCREALALSYHDLRYYMKPCFLYLSVFPEDYQIPARELIQLWIAEGFIQEPPVETMEDTADRLLEMFFERGLIQVVQRTLDGRVKTCRIHCLYRDFCVSEARREKFLEVHELENSPYRLMNSPTQLPPKLCTHLCSQLCFIRLSGPSSIPLSSPPHPHCFQSLSDLQSKLLYTPMSSASNGLINSPPQANPRRLAGNANSITDAFDTVTTFTNLRSFLCFTHMSTASETWIRLFKTTKFLRVLKVLYISILPEEVKNLVHLRYLGLNKNSLQQVPSSISNLVNLQVLDARSKFIRSVSPDIWKLENLRHVYFQGPTYLPPPPIPQAAHPLQSLSPSETPPASTSPSLKNLQTLSTISADSCTTEVFQKLPNLLNLGVIVKGHLSDFLSRKLEMLEKLRTLKLAGAADFPPLISLPLKFPPNLTKLTLSETKLEEDPMPFLGEVQNLEILKLSNNAYTKDEMVFHAEGFPKLKVLKLVSLEYILKLTQKGALRKLDRLIIQDCNSLQMFSGLEHLTALHVVEMENPSILLRQQVQQIKMKNQYQLHIYPPQDLE